MIVRASLYLFPDHTPSPLVEERVSQTTVDEVSCSDNEFGCISLRSHNFECFPVTFRCDGFRHCEDDSDEAEGCRKFLLLNQVLSVCCPPIILPPYSLQITPNPVAVSSLASLGKFSHLTSLNIIPTT